MASGWNKQALIEALRALEIDFPPTATMAQLKRLYNHSRQLEMASEEDMDELVGNDRYDDTNGKGKLIDVHNGTPSGGSTSDAANQAGCTVYFVNATAAAGEAILNAGDATYSVFDTVSDEGAAANVAAWQEITAAKKSADAKNIITAGTHDASASAAAATLTTSAETDGNAATSGNKNSVIVENYGVTSRRSADDAITGPTTTADNAANISLRMNKLAAAALDDEIKELKKQKEILELKRQIRELENITPSTSANRRQVEFSDVEYAIPKFSGDDISHSVIDFLREFSEVMASIGADDQFMFLGLRRSLTGTARQFLMTANVFTFQSLKQALLNEFGTVVSRRDVYRMLARRQWKKDEESLHCYILVMQAIAKRSDINETEVIDFIIDGIGNKVRNINLLVGARTLEELKKLVNRYQQKYLSQNAVADFRNAKPSAVAAKTPSADITADNPLCYNCSQKGHIKPNCPFPLRARGSCFRCWQMGHNHRECNNPKKILKAVPGKQVAAIDDELRELDSLNLSG